MKTESLKSNLAKAYEKKNALKLNLTAEQFTALSDIMCELATNQYEKGLNDGFRISEKYS